MQRSLLTYLEDIRLAIQATESFTAGQELIDYESDEMVRAAVERKLAIVGERLPRWSSIFRAAGRESKA